MKGRSFRDQEIGFRLHEASESWRQARPGNRFEKAPSHRSWISILLYCFLIAVFHSKLIFAEEDTTPIFTFLLPLAAGITFSSLLARYFGVRYDERSVLLPISSEQVHREILREWRNGIILTLLWIIFIGCFLGKDAIPWVGAIKTLLVFLSLTALMSLSLFPSLAWLSSAALWVFGSFLFTFYIGIFEGLLANQIAPFFPWHLALSNTPESWMALGGLLLAGIAALLATKSRWLSRPDFDPTYYYENLGGFSVENLENLDLEEEFLEESLPPPPATPKGKLESAVWRLLSTRERVLARAVGLCTETFLSYWLLITLFSLALPHFDFFQFGTKAFYLNILIFFPLLWLLISYSPKSDHYFTAVEIAPNCAAGAFAVLPIGFKTVEKLFYKECFLKWACVSLTITLFSTFRHSESLSGIVPRSLTLFLTTFVIIAIVHSVIFWSTGTSHWLKHKKRWGYSLVASLCFLAIILILLSQVFLVIGIIWEVDSLSELSFSFISLLLCIFLFWIARSMMILRLNDPRCDLLAQVDQTRN